MLLLRRASRHALAQRRALSAAPIRTSAEPAVKPARPEFSSGPCAKRPGWSPAVYESAATGRSHRSAIGKAKLKEAIETTRQVLNIPSDYKIAVAGLGHGRHRDGHVVYVRGAARRHVPLGVVRQGLAGDVTSQLKLDNVTEITAGYGELPDLSNEQGPRRLHLQRHDVGRPRPELRLIADDRTGLTFNDATSAVFAMDIDWSKVDVTTYSWQKVMGGEGAHGMLILSPSRRTVRIVHALEPAPPQDLPHDEEGQVGRGPVHGRDDQHALDGLRRGLPRRAPVGPGPGRVARSHQALEANLEAVTKWVNSTNGRTSSRGRDAVVDVRLPHVDTDPANVKAMVKMLEEADVAYDIGAYRDAPRGSENLVRRDGQHRAPRRSSPGSSTPSRSAPRSVSVDTPSPPSHRRRPFPAPSCSKSFAFSLLQVTVLGLVGGVPGGRHRASPIHRRRAGPSAGCASFRSW